MLDLNVWRALAVRGNDENCGGVIDTGAAAKITVGLDVSGQLALWIDGERQSDAVTLGKLLSKFAEHNGSGNGGLVGENLVAVFVAQRLALGIEPPGADRSVGTPRVIRDDEVVAYPGDL